MIATINGYSLMGHWICIGTIISIVNEDASCDTEQKMDNNAIDHAMCYN